MQVLQRLKDGLHEFNRFLVHNETLGSLVRFQHRHMPLPIPLFDVLFRNKVTATLLFPYGKHVFDASYKIRTSNDEYWTSRECLYCHLYRQRFVRWDVVEGLLEEPEIRAFLSRGDLAFLEPGFGTGRVTRALMERGLMRWRSYYATEPNAHLCDYVRRRFGKRLGESFEIHQGKVQDLVASPQRFDVLFANSGVLMFCPKDVVAAFFATLPQRGCRYVLITLEGSPDGKAFRDHDFAPAGNATQYAFRPLLETVYPRARFIARVGADGIYEYFCMVAD